MNAREFALKSLAVWRRDGVWLDRAWSAGLSKLPERERALAARIGYGVCGRVITLDACIKRVSKVAFSKIEPLPLDILRICAYQLFFTDKIPKHAAVSEAVNMAARHAPRAKNFVNAVSRALANLDGLPDFGSPWLNEGYPEWFYDKLRRDYGRDGALDFMRYCNEIPPLCLCVKDGVNPASISPELKPHPLAKNCYTLERSGAVEKLPGFDKGGFYVADPAAALSAEFAAPKPGERVFDACAAPGGKAVLLKRLCPEIKLTAGELYEHRMSELKSALQKYGAAADDYFLGSAARPPETFFGAFDLVLADVPCSGFGVIRKKPDIRLKPRGDAESMPEIQKCIAEGLADCVKPGGRMVYITCTTFREENEDVIAHLLEKRPEFTLTRSRRTFPPIDDCDAFYMAELVRVDS